MRKKARGAGYKCKSVEGLVPQDRKRYLRNEERERVCGLWRNSVASNRIRGVILGLVCLKENTAAAIVES